jgi:hypothetical protein|tara:strand:- start:105 stop:266 length:162 start_codon:yes stop_codon:yes gene_type:complete
VLLRVGKIFPKTKTEKPSQFLKIATLNTFFSKRLPTDTQEGKTSPEKKERSVS